MALETSLKLLRFCYAIVLVSADVRQSSDICDSKPCLSDFQQCVPLTDTDYECRCPDGCGGFNCSICADMAPSACSPSPCEGDCKCFESCKHARGFYCRSDAGYLGKTCTIPVPTLRCEPDRIVMSVSESFVNEYDMGMGNSYISIAPSLQQHSRTSCNVAFSTNGAYELTIPLPFTACNTTSFENGDSIQFTNQMWFNRDLVNAVFDMPIPAVEFQCTYNRFYKLVTSLQPTISNPGLVTSKKDIFPSISLCKVPTCPNVCPVMYQVTRGALYTVGEMIHVTMSLDSGSLTTGIAEMYLSCSGKSGSPRLLDIVSGGCEVESGLPSIIRSTFASAVVCVSFQTPRAPCREFYVHAELQSCAAENLQQCRSSNTLRCGSGRERRSEMPVTVLGPIFVIDGSRGEGAISINGMEDLVSDALAIGRAFEDESIPHEPEFRRPAAPASGDTALLIIIACGLAFLLILVLSSLPYARSRCS